MRLVLESFADFFNTRLLDNPDAFLIRIPTTWVWFFLRNRQPLLFIRYATDLITKWRNRMLPTIAQIIMDQQTVTLQHLVDIIDDEKLWKVGHRLTISNLNPKDR
ncbi:unnamed protein product [Rotaria sp. Silwood2]|nr:unnamed protein product [Rotaria sp. Silwood2]CAF4546795.1 unnamed protein product [Rotaria sp. Silwood2]CAF4594494.1 unnamed protein product [Rotaria sp. Silwood2]CAF4734831.1 unnamed protein product [Rotaria sp. Silwood2]